MSFIRWFLGKCILFINAVTLPKPIFRNEADQARVDKKTQHYTLYQFKACPFCVKVRRFIRKNSFKIELKDAKNNKAYKLELVNNGGKYKVPCLKIEKINAKTTWLYESDAIIQFLAKETELS